MWNISHDPVGRTANTERQARRRIEDLAEGVIRALTDPFNLVTYAVTELSTLIRQSEFRIARLSSCNVKRRFQRGPAPVQ